MIHVPWRYNLRSLLVRRTGTALSVFSIGLSVGVLVLVLALARGFELSLVETGTHDNLIVLRKGATSESESGLTRAIYRSLRAESGVALGPDGQPLVSAELYAALNLDKTGGGSANFTLRGVMLESFQVRDSARITRGRVFRPGTHEIVIGRSLVGRIEGGRLGGSLSLQGLEWPVVGILDCGGGAYDSEIWCDVEVFMQELNRPVYGVVALRRAEPSPTSDPKRDPLRQRLEADVRYDAKVFTETEYFRKQAGVLGDVLLFVAYFIAGIMATGAAFGTAVTLLSSLAQRSREVGTLLAIGFLPIEVMLGFLFEALLLGLFGGILGVLLAWPVNGLATGTMNWSTFTEQAFAFQITQGVIVQAIAFSTFVGVAAGVLPAWRASRLPPSVALRD